jgi:hypothetical protein
MDILLLHANFQSVNAKYAWNKIVHKQTASDPYTYLQGCTKKGPRGLLHKSFYDCVIFLLLTVFSNSAAEQERYYITNILKRSQHISMRQFVQHVEQLNSYIMQLPCWYYSPSAKPCTIPMNGPFAEADLGSHVLWMCPHTWQDQFNLHKKGTTPMDMRLLLMPLEAIECACTQERSSAQSKEKATGARKKTRGLVPNLQPGFSRKLAPRSIATSAISMGACIPRKTPKIVVGTRKTEQKIQFLRCQERRKETQSH